MSDSTNREPAERLATHNGPGLPAGSAREISDALQSEKPAIPSKYFYDERGSRLFAEITRLEEYYQARIEKGLLERHAPEILAKHHEFEYLVELGSGDCSKVSILFSALSQEKLTKTTYLPVDVSPSALQGLCCDLDANFPGLEIRPVLADFTESLDVLQDLQGKLVCFFGSTIGNLGRFEAKDFIARVSEVMSPGDRLLLGLDMVKQVSVLERAYNDKSGVTEAFNKNILLVSNHIAGTNFDPDDFIHRAFWVEADRRIEMHLEAGCNMSVKSSFMDLELILRKGETIHTENSHKFTMDDIEELAGAGGLFVNRVYTDEQQWFTLAELVSNPR